MKDEKMENLILKSSLKLQSIDNVSGLYEWNRRIFTLNVQESTLSSESAQEAAMDSRDSSKVTEFPISGALSAKEWTLASPMAGYGFDLTWASGKIWSFLADDQDTCSRWVASLNESISIAKEHSIEYMSTAAEAIIAETTILRSPDSIRSNQDKTVDQYNPSPPTSGSKEARTFSKSSPTMLPPAAAGGSGSRSRHRSEDNTQNRIFDTTCEEDTFGKQTGNISAIPMIDSSSSSSSSTPDTVSSSESGGNQDASPEPRRDGASLMETQRIFPQQHTFINPASMTMESYQQQMQRIPPPPYSSAPQDTVDDDDMIYTYPPASQTPPHPPPIPSLSVDPHAYDDLRQKFYDLQRNSGKDKIENEMLRDQVGRLQEEMETRTSMMEEELKETWEKYRSDNQGIRSDIEKRVTRAENKANSLHEAEMHSIREQHSRELECLREELSAERQRNLGTVNKDKELLAISQAKEAELRFEIQTMKDDFERLEGEVVKLREFGRLESLKWKNEKQSMQKDYDKLVQEITTERDNLLLKCQEEIRSKHIEMNNNFDNTVKDIEASIVETLKKEHESDKLMAIQQIQKKCTKDIENIRAEEKKLATKEIEAVRKMFMDREKQTAEDLNQLEKLHNDRYNVLEKKCTNLQKKNEEIKSQQKTVILERDNSLMDAQHSLETHLKHLEDHQQRGHKLALQLKEAHNEIKASNHRENDYRQQLAKSIEECRLQQAELIEIRRQASEAAAEAYAWKKAAQDSDTHHVVERKEIQIAKDEVAMLEHELKMIREENWHLKNKKGGRGDMSTNMMPMQSKVSPVSYPIRSANAISKKYSPTSSSTAAINRSDSANAASPSAGSGYRYYPRQVQFAPSNMGGKSSSSASKKYSYGSNSSNASAGDSTNKQKRGRASPQMKNVRHHPSTATRYASWSPRRDHPTQKDADVFVYSGNSNLDVDVRGSSELLPGYWVPSGISSLKSRHNSPARVAPSHVSVD